VTVLASIPSPSRGVIPLGPLDLHAYGLMIAMGVVAAVSLASHRLEARGGDPGLISSIAIWAVPGGLIGARLYHVATDWYRFDHGHWLDVFKVWEGGLGIWGGVLGGVLVGAWVARRRDASVPMLMDVVAPALPVAQAIGRWGNWFNQELFGKPTTLPWGLRIDPSHRPAGYERFSTFHPTFLYESLWCLLTAGVCIWVERRWPGRLKPGRLFAVYVAVYTFGRFWWERMRIDDATHVLGLRINEWVSAIVCLGAVAFVVTGLRKPVEVSEVDAADHR
jgi:prolipoprotein diacylglyceryl transferase